MARILVDGNAVGYAEHNATTLTMGEFQTQAVFGFVKKMHRLASEYPVHAINVLWDSPVQGKRYQLFPDYKATRSAADDPERLKRRAAYRAQLPLIHKMVTALGIPQIEAEGLEADDLGGILSRRFADAGEDVLLVTGDRDWLQLVNERVAWFDPRDGGKRIDHTNFFEATGYKTGREFLHGKCLVGDSSDDIPPVGGIGEKGAPVFIAQFRSVHEFWRRCDSGEFVPKTKAHINLWKGEGRANFERNFALMNLLDLPGLDRHTLKVTPGKFNKDIFLLLCERLGFMSIIKREEAFLHPFARRWQQRAAA